MADEPKNLTEPDRPKPEPENGPADRVRSFLEERFTPLRKKDEPGSVPEDAPKNTSYDDLVADLAPARVVGLNVPTLATFRGTIEAYSPPHRR